MSTLEPLQYFVGVVLVALVLTVWGLWSWCLRLQKLKDRYLYEASYERVRANELKKRLDDLLGRSNMEKYGEYRHRVLAEYGNGRAAKK